MYWQALINDQRPQLEIKLNGKSFVGLVDTGADVTIISKSFWPKAWPLQEVPTVLTGIGTMTDIFQSRQILNCSGPDGQTATLKPYVANITINLWGRDLLQQWGAYINIPNTSAPAKQIMLNMNYNPCFGLGKRSQGAKTFEAPKAHTSRHGLCYPNFG